MKRSIKILALSMISLCSIAAVTVSTVAWFSTKDEINYVDGGAVASYFKSGHGTEQDPYIIASRNHVYNLAWLQYIGYFNDSTNFGGLHQYYFEVENDIDMEGLTIPPIGTEKYPFLGHFDGNGNTISNFTISNDDPAPDSSDFGVAKPVNLYDGEVSNIVGFFGVVGQLPTQSLNYDSSIVSICNIKLDNFSITSETSETLIGLAAGYVDGALSEVKVGTSEIEINDCAPITSITSNLSDYSLVGYCANTNTVSDFTKKVSEQTHKTVSGGQDGGFGASVNFKDYTTWFYDLHDTKTYDTSNKAADIGFMNDTNASSSNSLRYNRKTGTNYLLTLRVPNAGLISDPEYYMSISCAYYPSNGQYYNYEFNFHGDGTGLYKEYTYASAGSSYSQSFTWTENNLTGTNKRYLINFSTGVSRFSNATQIDLKCTATSGGAPLYFRPVNRGGTTQYLSINFYITDNHVYHLTNENYLPLTFNDAKTAVSTANTGYITGTSLNSDTNYVGTASPRLASYSSAYLSGSMSNGNINTVKTYDGGEWKTITETKENGEVTSISNVSFTSGKYISARNVLAQTVEGKETVHGIHFDVSATNTYASGKYRGSIDGDEYVKINNDYPYMMLKSYGGTAKKTKMPKGCIDFELEDCGYITFFAGFYNSNTDTTKLNFFSLHHVDRTSPTSYTIKEIKKIYKSTAWTEDDPDYVYEYNTNPVSYSTGTRNGDPIFDLSTALWPARDKDNSIYYFEIPVKKGEYVMGAVDKQNSGGTAYQGAYMMYLDIGSNGKSTGDNTMDAFYTETSSDSDSFPEGVDFSITGLSSVGGQTGCLAIQYTSGTVDGSVSFIVAADIVVDATIENCNINYKADDDIFDVEDSTEEIGDITGASNSGQRIIIASITLNNGDTWNIEYQEKLDGSGGTYTRIVENGVDRTSSGSSIVPTIFTNNLSDIKAAIMAVQLEYTGTDFNVTNATYVGTTISLTIPPEELGSTALTVTFGTNYSALNINGSAYPTS